MRSMGAARAECLESLVEVIATATIDYRRAFIRNANVWIEEAVAEVELSNRLESAARAATADVMRLADALEDGEAPVDGLRAAATNSVKSLQTALVEDLPPTAPASIAFPTVAVGEADEKTTGPKVTTGAMLQRLASRLRPAERMPASPS